MSYGEGAPNTSPLFRFDCSYYSHTHTPDSDSISQLLYGETYVEHILLTRGNAKIMFCWPDKSIVSDRSIYFTFTVILRTVLSPIFVSGEF